MKRKIIRIDEEKCTGCGICVDACHEGAIGLVDGKARLLRDDYCDGLGDCLPACPADAISFEEREAKAYDAAAVAQARHAAGTHGGGMCPGSAPRTLHPDAAAFSTAERPSALTNWPVQIKLAPYEAPVYQGAKLLVAADCTAFAFAAMHERFMAGCVTLIGCPKLDGVDYSEKLAQIMRDNDIAEVQVVRMEVPCCGGLAHAVEAAVAQSGKNLDVCTTIISLDGRIVSETVRAAALA